MVVCSTPPWSMIVAAKNGNYYGNQWYSQVVFVFNLRTQMGGMGPGFLDGVPTLKNSFKIKTRGCQNRHKVWKVKEIRISLINKLKK